MWTGKGWRILLLFWLTGCDLRSVAYEIPEGYVGWVVIRYGVIDCASTSDTLGKSVIQVSADGRGCSSIGKMPGTKLAHRYYTDDAGQRIQELKFTGWGKGGLVWAPASGEDGGYEYFYVGSEKNFKARIGGGSPTMLDREEAPAKQFPISE